MPLSSVLDQINAGHILKNSPYCNLSFLILCSYMAFANHKFQLAICPIYVCFNGPVSFATKFLLFDNSLVKSALKFQRQILTINVPSYKTRRQNFSLSVHANLYYTSVGMLLNYSVIEYWRHEFCQVQERQLGRFYLHSATLQCRPNHRHLWLLPNSI